MQVWPCNFKLIYVLLWGLPRWFRGKKSTCQCKEMQGTWIIPLGWEDPLEKEMATHSSILAWEIPWTEEPDGLQSWDHKESNMTDLLSTCTSLWTCALNTQNSLEETKIKIHVNRSSSFSLYLSIMFCIKLPTSAGSPKKQESSRKISISALLTMPKPLTVWITINCGKFWKRWDYQTTWPAS